MGEVTTPDAFAAALKAAVPGARVKIADPPGAGVSLMDMRHVGDLALAKETIGYQPQYGIEAAVRDMVAWYRSNERGRPAH